MIERDYFQYIMIRIKLYAMKVKVPFVSNYFSFGEAGMEAIFLQRGFYG
jgi:hypothetical protein